MDDPIVPEIIWETLPGSLAILNKPEYLNIPLIATSNEGDITFTLVDGELPEGVYLTDGVIVGEPEIPDIKSTTSEFTIRAYARTAYKDRTFSISIDYNDKPDWITPAGSLGVITERRYIEIPLEATSEFGPVSFSLLAGNLPKGLKLVDNVILGSPIEVSKFTESKFVIRADSGYNIEDRTFTLSVDGADYPEWITKEGFLNVGPANAYFVLDNAKVDFQLEAFDEDESAGDVLEYRLMPRGGELPPGLSLSTDGRITGFTDPIFAFDMSVEAKGGYDVNPFDITPNDFREIQDNGFDTYFYDNVVYDYHLENMMPRRLSRVYTFVVAVNDGLNTTTRTFKIYVVTEEFLKADNTLVAVDTNVFTADSSSRRVPIWITESDLGRIRANNYVTIFLDVYKPESLPGTISYMLPSTNPGLYQLLGTTQIVSGNYEISGELPAFKYNMKGNWRDDIEYRPGDAVLFYDDIHPEITNQTWVCLKNNTAVYPVENEYWTKKNIVTSRQEYTLPNTLLWEPIALETTSQFPPGLEFDLSNGQLAGRVPYQSAITKTFTFTVDAIYYPSIEHAPEFNFMGDWNASINYVTNDTVRYDGNIYIAVTENINKHPTELDTWIPSVSITSKTFTVDIFGEIDSAIEWVTDADLGTIKPNIPSQLSVVAESLLYGNTVRYEMVGGELPPGLEFLPNGIIQGKVKQFADEFGPGLTRFFDANDSTQNFELTFDGGATSFDKTYYITVQAWDSLQFAKAEKTFFIKVVADQDITFVNLHVKAFPPKENRLLWNGFITDVSIFPPDLLYRNGDPNFATQTEIKMLVFAGIEKTELPLYISAISRNHYRKRILLGDVKSAVAKDPETQEPIYEVVYVDVIDDYEKDGISISDTIELPNWTDSKELVNTSYVTADSDIQLASESDHQKIFPNSIKNMRKRIKAIGERDRDYLPLWMRSIQPDSRVETGFVKALVLCYTKPGKANIIKAKIKARNFDFKDLDFEIDRYLIDIIYGNIQDKYFAFPHPKEKEL